MNKTFKKVALLAVAALPLGFVSCGDGDSDGPAPTTSVVTNDELDYVAQTYVNDVVYPTYKELAENAAKLRTACSNLYYKVKDGTVGQTDVDAACEAFKDTRRQWERSEAFLYGAATDNNIDPHIDSWPLDQQQMKEALTNESVISGMIDGWGRYVYVQNKNFDSTMGFHGLEFVLFRDGKNRPAADFLDKDDYEGFTTVDGLSEAAFAKAVSEDIDNMLNLLEYGWNADADKKLALQTNCQWVLTGTKNDGLSSLGIGYGPLLLNATKSNGYFSTWQETLENILVAGCSKICQEVYTQKLGQAYRVATGHGGTTEDGEKESIDYIESPYSQRSFIDYRDNIYSIQNSLYGTRDIDAEPKANSLMTIMSKYNYANYNSLKTALENAKSALDIAVNSGIPFVKDPANDQVKNAIAAIKTLDEELNTAGNWFRYLKTK